MRVAEVGLIVKNQNELRKHIKIKYKTVRRFSEKTGYTESAISYILHGKRKIYSWNLKVFSETLEMSEAEFRKLIIGGK